MPQEEGEQPEKRRFLAKLLSGRKEDGNEQ